VIDQRHLVVNDPELIAAVASHPMVGEPDPIVYEPPTVVTEHPPILRDEEPIVVRSRSFVEEPSRSIFFNEATEVAQALAPIEVEQALEPIEVAEVPEPVVISQPIEVVSHADVPDASAVLPAPKPAVVETAIETRTTQPRPATAPITSFETALAAIRAAWAGPTRPNTSSARAHTVGHDIDTHSVPRDRGQSPANMMPSPHVPAAPATTPVRPAQVEVDLTGDIDALEEMDPSRPGADESPESPKTRKSPPRTPNMRAANGSPVQDEWGMFDPNQCGFSALVDKLDEVADPQDHPARSTKVRVISVG